MFWSVLIITILFLLLAFILLSVRVILKRNGKFSSQHISQSKAMRERGISCVNSQDRQAQNENHLRIDVNNL